MKFTSKNKIGYGSHWKRVLRRYQVFKRIMKLRKKYKPIEIYNQLGCSKAYFYGLLEWRFDISPDYLINLEGIENVQKHSKNNR